MPISVLMPSLSPTMEEGVLAKWLVKEGDYVKSGSMLCSVETDKTTVDYETVDEGFLRKILVPDGSPAKVNQLIAILTEEKDEDFSEFLEKAIQKNEQLLAKSKPAATGQSEPKAQTAPAPVESIESPTQQRTSFPTSSPASSDERLRVSPLARKMAEAGDIPLQEIQGSGPGGRIVKRDVEQYKPSAVSQAIPGAAKAALPQKPVYGSQAAAPPTKDISLNKMRQIIGKRLLESTQGTPVFYVTMKVAADSLNQLRTQLNQAPGYKISVNDLVVKAAAFALRQFPQVNSSYHGEFIRQHGNIDICIAVSMDGGLITPIVKDVDRKGLGQISSEIKGLVAKAKSNKLAPEEYQGGTFTISNMGMYGVDEFTAIINPPQAAILAVSGIQNELFKDGEQILERSLIKVTLSADHRVIDGALAAQFLGGLKAILENPVCLML